MKTLYFECNMGAAGDMLMAALLELHPDPLGFLQELNNIGIPGVAVRSNLSAKCGITGTHIQVKVNGREEISHDHHHEHDHDHHNHGHHSHEHHAHGHHNHEHHSHEHHSHEHQSHEHHDHDHHSHGSYHEIKHTLSHLKVSEAVKSHALGIYQLIAEAESHAHGVPVSQIHFHEVGELDAVADIVGVCMLIEALAPDVILASPIHVGSGQVRCAHGILPVPAPATAHILQDVPIYGGDVCGELCTPTGAAILKHFVKEFVPMPIMKVSKIGYGMGKKDFEQANCVRACLGKSENKREEVVELACNLDDMTPETIAFAQQLLLEEGALDVYTIPIGMKKSRPGVLFTCLCKHDLRDEMVRLIFKHTTTLGIREATRHRYTLSRVSDEVQTAYGSIRRKTAQGYGITKTKMEYEDIAKIARENGLSFAQVMDELRVMVQS